MAIFRFICALLFTAFILLSPTGVSAQLTPDTIDVANSDTRYDSLKEFTPSEYLKTVLNFLLGAGGVAAFVYLLWGGLQWVSSGGDKEGIEKARKKILNALIGLVVVFSSYTLLYIMRVLFKIDLIQVNLTRIGASILQFSQYT